MTKLESPRRATAHTGRKHSRSLLAMLLPPLVLLVPVTLLIALSGFDGLYGQDAYAYYGYATGPLRDSLLALQPPPAFFWPPGYPLLVLSSSLLMGVRPLAGQLVSLMAGALVPLFTVLLARELWPAGERPGSWIPLLAGLLTASVGQLWQSSAVIMSDTPGLAAATLGMWAAARYGREHRGWWLLLAAAAMAFAVLTRWAFALVAVPATVYALTVLMRQPRRRAAVHALAAALAVVAILSPVILPVVRQAFTPGAEQTAFVGDLQVYRWSPLNALRREFVTVDGHLRYRLPNGLYYALAPAHRYFFTPLLALFLLPGFWLLWRERSAARLLLLAGWAGTVYAFHAGAAWQNFRFTLAYLPPLAILAAVGIVAVRRWLPGRTTGRAFAALLAAGLLWMAANGWTLTDSFIQRKQANLTTVRWVTGEVEPDALLLTFWITPAFEQYSSLETTDLFSLSPGEMSVLLKDDRPAYLLLDLQNIEAQWTGRPPEANYRWLQQERGLLEIGQHRQFTLYRIGHSRMQGEP